MRVFFQRQPFLVEAYQYGAPSPPDWYEERVRSETIRESEHYCEILTFGGIVRVEREDWVVRDGYGRLSQCDRFDFERNYKLLKDPA